MHSILKPNLANSVQIKFLDRLPENLIDDFDGFFESIRVQGRSAFLLGYHQKRVDANLTKCGLAAKHTFSLSKYLEKISTDFDHEKEYKVRMYFLQSKNNQQLYTTFHVEELRNHGFVSYKNGLRAGIYSKERKIGNTEANVKSIHRSLYENAQQYARGKKIDEAILLNDEGRICESAISNIFIFKDNNAYTNPLSENCVNGVMRSYLLAHLGDKMNIKLQVEPISLEMLQTSDEIWLTNAVSGIRWIRKMDDTKFSNRFFQQIEATKLFIAPDN